jgi:alpha-ketoglutarate-dependent taurine dioxygenase
MTQPQAWDAKLGAQLGQVTIVAPLDPALVTDTVDVVRRFGFAIIESPPSELSGEAIERRSDQLLAFGDTLGVPVAQSPRRALVEDVKDYSDVDEHDDNRGYRSGGELTPHSDPPTLILLHCLQPARTGGESSLVSVASIVERMEQRAPGSVDELFAPLPDWSVAGQYGISEEGPAPHHRPVLTRHEGVLSCVLYRPYIERAAEAIGAPLSPAQRAALDLFEECSASHDLTLRFVLQPGQTLVLHNRSVLHARTDFVDWPELDRRRHLLRMWIDAPETFPVHPDHELGDFFAPV